MIDLSKARNINHLWGKLIIEELIRCGVDYFCISPGSRSAPLVTGVAENKRAESCVHYDERGLAYHALGYVSSTGKPACVIVTSGTAVANCFPAVIEASKKKIPLIILSADRPPELRHTGANQVIDQVKIFGDYARFYFDMPCPSVEVPLEMVLTTICQAVYRSKSGIPGPAHINCMFREPLVPLKDKKYSIKYSRAVKQWAMGELPFTRYILPGKGLLEPALASVVTEIEKIKKGIIVVGKLKGQEERESVLKIARKLNWPVFPDIGSGLRFNSNDSHIIHYFDQLLLDSAAAVKFAPDGILHLGGRMTSRRLLEFIESSRPIRYIMALNHPLRNDPLHNVTLRVESAAGNFCDALYGNLKPREEKGYVSLLKKESDKISKSISSFCAKQTSLTAPGIARVVCGETAEKTGVFLASSMSIRIMDMFCGKNDNFFIFGSNRGASGIDGTIATAAGFAKGINAPCVLLLGDLSFLHDLNSLSLLKSARHPFVIIVLNDNGGGIFSFLPIASFSQFSEKYFFAPHGLNFEQAGKMFGIPYERPKNIRDFSDSYKKALKGSGPVIIEIILSREANSAAIKTLQKGIIKSLKQSRACSPNRTGK